MMLKNILFILVLIVSSCKKTKTNDNNEIPLIDKSINYVQKEQETEEYRNIKDCTCNKIETSFNKNENKIFRTLIFNDINLTTFFEYETTYLSWRNSNPYPTNLIFYNEIIDNESIMLFSCKGFYILALEVFTEEFPIYQIIKLQDNGNVSILGDYSISAKNFNQIYGKKELVYCIVQTNGKNILFSKGNNDEVLGLYDVKIDSETIDLKKGSADVDDYLNIRSKPSLSGSKIIDKIPSNKEFILLNQIDEKWTLVYFKGNYGYVSSEFIKKIN